MLALATSGCAWTVFTAVDAAGSAIQAGYAIAANYSSPAYVTGSPANVRMVCIELNPNVSTIDIIPAMQIALEQRGIASGIYNPGAAPAGCEAQLTYSATVSYGRRALAGQAVQYLSAIDMTLVERGRIIVNARYETGGLDTDRYSSTAIKVKGIIDKIVVDKRGAPSLISASSTPLAPPGSGATPAQ
ncbi:hypothetical protein WKR88_12185 [Trinickia caryophylli]|uniref:hypothetical protein n=1 Tax=Trinickia caryophylli TaxID=28094 RepID=UPI001E617005|nr:hypothetical protein [Trinickia caryophylli]WQE13644.1 hypothetical protein U0034_07740 [Trinickia caryophylli]